MELQLRRTHKLHDATTGILAIDGKFQCYVCEDTVRDPGVKVPGKTAIPPGRYEIIVTRSQRFNRDLPLLLNVPMFEGVRIHPGNCPADTEGCLLPGKGRDASLGTVSQSRAAFTEVFEKIQAALVREKVIIEIG